MKNAKMKNDKMKNAGKHETRDPKKKLKKEATPKELTADGDEDQPPGASAAQEEPCIGEDCKNGQWEAPLDEEHHPLKKIQKKVLAQGQMARKAHESIEKMKNAGKQETGDPKKKLEKKIKAMEKMEDAKTKIKVIEKKKKVRALKNGAEKIHEARDAEHARASIGPNDERGRMITLSRGRAGSTILSHTIASFALANAGDLGPCNVDLARTEASYTGSVHCPATFIQDFGKEIFGEHSGAMKNVSNPVKLMSDWYQKQAVKQPAAPLLGFKWKPELANAAYNGALDWVASQNVSVLWMTRNLLDVRMSQAKHYVEPSLGSHCEAGDDECIAKHQDVQVSLEQITDTCCEGENARGKMENHQDKSKTLVDFLAADKQFYETELEAMLIAKGVRYKHVKFEDLFETTSTANTRGYFVKLHHDSVAALKQWNSVFAFLGLPKVDTYEEIVATADEQQESTSPPTQCDSMSDPDKVREALKGSEFEGLLGSCSVTPKRRSARFDRFPTMSDPRFPPKSAAK